MVSEMKLSKVPDVSAAVDTISYAPKQVACDGPAHPVRNAFHEMHRKWS